MNLNIKQMHMCSLECWDRREGMFYRRPMVDKYLL